MEDQMKLRVLIRQEHGIFVAQCLEYDIGAQASSLEELKSRFEMTLQAELQETMQRHNVPFHGIPEAPSEFFRLWNDTECDHPEPVVSSAVEGNKVEYYQLPLCA